MLLYLFHDAGCGMRFFCLIHYVSRRSGVEAAWPFHLAIKMACFLDSKLAVVYGAAVMLGFRSVVFQNFPRRYACWRWERVANAIFRALLMRWKTRIRHSLGRGACNAGSHRRFALYGCRSLTFDVQHARPEVSVSWSATFCV